MNLKKRTMDEMITHFNDVVSEMNISRKDKMTLLGMITAIGYEAQNAADVVPVRWIPVAHKMPNPGSVVLAWSPDLFTVIAYYNGEEEWDIPNPNITHWMPLPEPPKECEDYRDAFGRGLVGEDGE